MTTEMRQDLIFGPFQGRNGQVGGLLFRVVLQGCNFLKMLPSQRLRTRRKKEYYFKSWMGPGPNSENRPRMGSGSEAKHRKSLPNRRQQGAPSAPPKGAALRAAPLGSCCLLFGKDFLCFASFPEPILGRFPEFGPNLVRNPSRI